MSDQAEFYIGQVVNHRLFGYTGVIFDIDPVFSFSSEWYEETAKSRPPKDLPWYHVLVDNAIHTTYVAEQNLEKIVDPEQINHPLLGEYFSSFIDGRYILRYKAS